MPNVGSSERKPALAEVLDRARTHAREDLHTCIPAVVVKYDASKQRVDVKPLVKNAYLDENDTRQVESVPVVPSVPLQFPGAGPFRVTFPISDGTLVINGQTIPATTGTLLTAERSIDKWLTGKGGEVDPEIDHDHHIADGIFIAGLNPFGAPLTSVPTDHITVGVDGPDDGQHSKVHIRNATICIGDESGSKAVGLDQDTVNCGTLTGVIAQAGPTVTVTLNYTPPGGVPSQVLTFSATGSGTPGTFPIPLSGKLQASAVQAKAK